jgi:zinc protease
MRHRLAALLGALALASAPCLAGPSGAAGPPADPFASARTFRLDNGLTCVLKADASRPVVAVQMLYTVGARNETIGLTGISHFLEHMLFRGTTSFGLQDITGVIERAGGEWHGYTYIDCTTFFEAAPKDLLPVLLRLEAERMTVARMAANEVDPERGAVFQEYRGYQLDARSDLFDAVAAILFLQHSYRNNTMGWESDLAGITHQDLVAFYRTYYGPRNAVLAISGDIDDRAIEEQVRALFGAIPAGGADTRIRTVEPPVAGTRRVTLRRKGAEPALMVAFLAAPPTKPREYARLLLLDAILGGAKGLSFYRHSGDLTAGASVEPGSRLGKTDEDSPVERFGTALVPSLYPYLYAIYATPRADRTMVAAETVIFRALRRVAASVSQEEVRQAAGRILAADLPETDAPVEVTHELAFWTALGGLELRHAILTEVGSVTPREVQDLAAGLTVDSAVIGTVLPEAKWTPEPPSAAQASPTGTSEPGTGPASEGAAAKAVTDASSRPKAPEVARAPTVRTRPLPSGGRAIIDARPDQRTFVLRLALGGSSATAGPGAPRLAAAAAAMQEDRDARGRLAAAGVRMTAVGPGEAAFADRDTLQIEAAGPADALAEAVTILGPALGRALLAPPAAAAPPSGDPGERSLGLLAQAVAAPSPAAGTRSGRGAVLALVSPLSPESAEPWLARLAAAVPPADRGAGASPQVGATGSGDAPGAKGATPVATGTPFASGRLSASLENISQGHLLLAVPGDEDAAAQEAVAWILHHNYGGRLGSKAIAEMGLVYDMDSESVRRGARLVYFTMGADPEALGRLESALVGVLDAARQGVTEQEVAEFRSFLPGSLVVRLADPAQAARLYCSALLRGEDDTVVAAFAGSAKSLTRERVAAAAHRMLDPARRLSVVVGRAAK